MTSPYRMRRHARRIRRSGLQPMMLITGNDPLPESMPVLVLRWTWRYRSELGPLGIALAVLATGLWLHADHPDWWPAVAEVSVAAGCVLAFLGPRLGVPTRAESLYAAAVVLGTGGWLTAAMVAGPLAGPLPVLLLIGGLALSVPWWMHGRRRARVKVERKLAVWPEIAQAVGLGGTQVMSAVADLWGWRARFRLARGQTINDVIAKVPAIESGLGTFRGSVRVSPTPDDLANRFELRVLDKDPHADAIAWPGPSTATITEPVDLGPFEDATPARVLLLRRHALFGGATGSGKSGGLNVLMGNLTACRDVVIWAIDLKRGMELGPWAPCIDRLATTPAEARALLADAVTILEARAQHLAAAGQRIWKPSPDWPALIIIADEYAELADNAPEAAPDADSIARLGRAVAVTLIAATQRPTQKAMGQGALRSQMDVRVCFRVRERRDVDLILGQGMLAAGWQAHTLNAPGKFLISAPEHDTPRRARAYLVTDQAVTETATWHQALRPELDEVSRRALAERPYRHPDATGDDPGTHDDNEDAGHGPEELLWTALCLAPAGGVPIADLVTATGMSQRWVHYRLRTLASTGRAIQVKRGIWRATTSQEGDAQ
jgi:hypothetical protein